MTNENKSDKINYVVTDGAKPPKSGKSRKYAEGFMNKIKTFAKGLDKRK